MPHPSSLIPHPYTHFICKSETYLLLLLLQNKSPMHRIHLGEFEELVLLLVAVLHGNAYGVSVMEEIETQTGRSVNISAVHAALRRLEEKGYLRSEWSEASTQRGGRRKRLFELTQTGRSALERSRDTYLKLWEQIPGFAPKISFV